MQRKSRYFGDSMPRNYGHQEEHKSCFDSRMWAFWSKEWWELYWRLWEVSYTNEQPISGWKSEWSVYDPEDSNTKFLRGLPKKWDTRTSIIKHQYDLDNMTLDEIHGMLRTHDLEIQQTKKRKSNKGESISLNVEFKYSKLKMVESSKRRSNTVKSDNDD